VNGTEEEADIAILTVKEKSIVIHFNELFDLETPLDIDFCTFDLSKKRIFISAIGSIGANLETIFINVPSFIEVYMNMKYMIDSKEVCDPEGIKTLLRENIANNEEVKDFVTAYVKENHNISIEAKNNNEELQFTDSMARMIICIAIFSRISIPLVSHYLFVNGIKKDDDLFVDVFNQYYMMYDTDDEGIPVNITAKLNKFISAAVDKTLYSDKVIWNYLANISIHSKILSIELFKRIVRDIVPKLELDKSIISFLHVVLKKQIEFQFTQNIKINFKPIAIVRTESENGNNINPFTKIEQRLIKANEADYILNKEAINIFINENTVLKNPEEFEYYFQGVKITNLQTRIVSFFMSKMIGQGISLSYCDRREYIEILMITKKWLEKNKFVILSKVLLAEPVPKQVKKNFSKGNLLGIITESKSYENIMQKYNILQQKIVDGKIIVNFIGEILNTDFNYFPLFTEPKDSVYNFEDIPLKNGIGEILLFLEKL
jgi:hypothetical protein